MRNDLTQLGILLDRSSFEVYLLDSATLGYTYANAGACSALGYTVDELAQLSPRDLLPLLDRKVYETLAERARIADPTPIVVETLQRRSNGSHYPVEARFQYVASPDKPLILVLVQDISERERATAKAEHAATVEREKELAEAENKAKGRLVATLSYDIRSPINGVLGMADMLMSTALTGEQREYATMIRDSALSLLAIIDDDMSSLKGGSDQHISQVQRDINVGTADGESSVSQLSAPTRILVVEDNPVNQKLALLQIRKLGYEVEAVSRGEDAVAAAMSGAYGLLLMDCQMPGMDGFEATAAIRVAERAQLVMYPARLPIIAMTANALQGDRDACLAAGMDDYIAKPVNKDQLANMLAKWMAAGSANTTIGARSGQPSLGEALPLDLEVLATLRTMDPEGGQEFLDQLIGLFLDDTPRIFDAIQKAIVDKDSAALQRGAHRLRGSSANFGAAELVLVCQELERLGRAGTTVGAGERFLALKRAYARVVRALEDERQRVVA